MKTKILSKVAMIIAISVLSTTVALSQDKKNEEKKSEKKEVVITKERSGCGGMGMGYGPMQQNGGCGGKGGFCCIPNLTDEQKEKIEKSRLQHQKAMIPLRNQLAEKKAHLKTISTGDNVDMNAVNATIDEISKIKGDMMKLRYAHKQEIRKLLNDEQKVYYDLKGIGAGGFGHGKMKNPRKGHKMKMFDDDEIRYIEKYYYDID